jgi:hypothetical protein
MATKNIIEEMHDRRAQVNEIRKRQSAHVKKIRDLEMELIRRRSLNKAEITEERAEAFFRDGSHMEHDLASLQVDLRKLNEQSPLFDVEIARRQKLVDEVQGQYNKAIFAPLKPEDDVNKLEMANTLVMLARCCAREISLANKIRDASANPPACFRPMRPNFIGQLDDPNSFMNQWLRELQKYYPHVYAKITR